MNDYLIRNKKTGEERNIVGFGIKSTFEHYKLKLEEWQIIFIEYLD